jgi:hypothetical protein
MLRSSWASRPRITHNVLDDVSIPEPAQSNDSQQTSHFSAPRMRRFVTRCWGSGRRRQPRTGVRRLQEPAVDRNASYTRALLFLLIGSAITDHPSNFRGQPSSLVRRWPCLSISSSNRRLNAPASNRLLRSTAEATGDSVSFRRYWIPALRACHEPSAVEARPSN